MLVLSAGYKWFIVRVKHITKHKTIHTYLRICSIHTLTLKTTHANRKPLLNWAPNFILCLKSFANIVSDRRSLYCCIAMHNIVYIEQWCSVAVLQCCSALESNTDIAELKLSQTLLLDLHQSYPLSAWLYSGSTLRAFNVMILTTLLWETQIFDSFPIDVWLTTVWLNKAICGPLIWCAFPKLGPFSGSQFN